jgi:hypothetical protein
MIDGVTAGENNTGVRGDIDLLLAKILGGNPFEFNKGTKFKLKIKLLRQFEIRRLITLRTRLRDQNVLDRSFRHGAFTPFTTHVLTGNWVQK